MCRLSLAAIKAIFKCLASAVEQKLDGPFTPMQLLTDVGQLTLAPILQFNGFTSTWPQSIHTDRQVPHHIFILAPQCVGRHDGFQFQAQLRPGYFLTSLHPLDVFTQQVTSDPQQPGANQCCGVKPGLRKVEPQEYFLSHVISIG